MIKKTTLSIFSLFIGFLMLLPKDQVQAQEKYVGIKTNPVSTLGGPFWLGFVPLTGEFRISAEGAFTDFLAVEVGGSYLTKSPLINLENWMGEEIKSFNTNGYRFQGAVKVYILSFFTDQKAPSGLYAAPNMSFSSVSFTGQFKAEDSNQNIDEYDYELGITKSEFGLQVGYQLLADGGFTFDPFVKMNYRVFSTDYTDNYPYSSYEEEVIQDQNTNRSTFFDGTYPTIGFNLGVFIGG